MKELQESIVLQALFDPTAFIDGPTWMRLLTNYGRVPGLLTNPINMTMLGTFVKNEFLNSDEVHQLVCVGDEFDTMIIMKNITQKVYLFHC